MILMSKSTSEHKKHVPLAVNFALITVSSSRYDQALKGETVDDETRNITMGILSLAGKNVVYSDLVSDDFKLIKNSLKKAIDLANVDAVITFGGTGITNTDVTIETIAPLFEKDIPGFGELFRKLSYDEIGSAAMITRATAGLIKDKPVFCLPGSPQGVSLVLNKLILPEIGHIIKHARE